MSNITVNSFLSIYLFYFIIVYFGNFSGGKNRGSMDLLHILVDPARGPGPRRGPCFVLSRRKHTKYVNHYDCYHPIGATQQLAHFNLLMVTLFV